MLAVLADPMPEPVDPVEALIARAELEKKWLVTTHGELWFSPLELRSARSEGFFRWPAGNFELRDPQLRQDELLRRVSEARAQHEAFMTRRVRSGT
jgi:hypothetical protein